MHAYEAILTAVQALYTYEYNCIQRDATQVLAHFHAGTGSILPLAVQEKMRTMKNDASRLAARVEGFGRAIASLVSDYVDRLLPCFIIFSLYEPSYNRWNPRRSWLSWTCLI